MIIKCSDTAERTGKKAFVLKKAESLILQVKGVIGANVKLVDSTEGTITDMDGNFSLMVTRMPVYPYRISAMPHRKWW